MRAAELAEIDRVYQMTFNRDHMIRGMRAFAEQARAAGVEISEEMEPPDNMGKPEGEITARFDVSEQAEVKRASMRAHASQIGENHGMLTLPEEAFRYAFGTEWAIRAGQGPGITETDLFAETADPVGSRSRWLPAGAGCRGEDRRPGHGPIR